MPSRRNALIATGSLAASSIAGCVDIFATTPEIREVNILLDNDGNSSQTFRFALETEDGVQGWKSYTIDGNDSRAVTVHPPEEAKLVALRGEVNGSEKAYEFDDLSGSNEEACLYMYLRSQYPKSTRHCLRREDIHIDREPDQTCY